MTATRTKPEIHKASTDDSSGYFQGLPGIVFWCFITFIFVRIMSGTATIFEQGLCVGVIVVFMVLMFWNEAKKKREKEKWRAACLVDWLAILDRHGSPGGSFEDGYGDIHSYRSSYYLELEMNADQRTVAPNEKVVRVDIGGTIYNRLLGRKTVCIYYQPEAPLAFFIAEEF